MYVCIVFYRRLQETHMFSTKKYERIILVLYFNFIYNSINIYKYIKVI
jgi:hypothetical protein